MLLHEAFHLANARAKFFHIECFMKDVTYRFVSRMRFLSLHVTIPTFSSEIHLYLFPLLGLVSHPPAECLIWVSLIENVLAVFYRRGPCSYL